jgi:hypothetical protein
VRSDVRIRKEHLVFPIYRKDAVKRVPVQGRCFRAAASARLISVVRFWMILLATSAIGDAQSRPDFSGVWDLNIEKSRFRGKAPGKILMKIEHTEPKLVQRILVAQPDGSAKVLVFTYETTGQETSQPQAGGTARSQARWEGSELIIESWMKTGDRELHFKDHWSLSSEHSVLTMTHRDDDLAGQTSVLEKAPPEAAQKFINPR